MERNRRPDFICYKESAPEELNLHDKTTWNSEENQTSTYRFITKESYGCKFVVVVNVKWPPFPAFFHSLFSKPSGTEKLTILARRLASISTLSQANSF